jgi:hypothetical protein
LRHIAFFFGLLAVGFLSLSFVHGTTAARKTWRRTGIIFAIVGLVIFSRCLM